MSKVEYYFEQWPEGLKMDLLKIHRFLIDNFELDPRLMHSLPFYYGHSWICYLNVTKNKEIELGFTRGNEMSLTWSRLSMRDRKQVASVIFSPNENFLTVDLEETLQEAILIDEMNADAKRKAGRYRE